MSKNECKRCSECKHYERVNDNEPEDHGDCTLYPVWVDVWAAHYCGQWASTEDPQALDIEWEKVPEGYDWAAQDSNGDIYAWATEPKIIETEEGCWRWRGDKDTHYYVGHTSIRAPRFRNNVTKRPGT